MTDPREYLAPNDDPGATPAQKVAALAVLATLHPDRLFDGAIVDGSTVALLHAGPDDIKRLSNREWAVLRDGGVWWWAEYGRFVMDVNY